GSDGDRRTQSWEVAVRQAGIAGDRGGRIGCEHDGAARWEIHALARERGRRAVAAVTRLLARPQHPPAVACDRRKQGLGERVLEEGRSEIDEHQAIACGWLLEEA